jgi:tricorn protease-like protein
MANTRRIARTVGTSLHLEAGWERENTYMFDIDKDSLRVLCIQNPLKRKTTKNKTIQIVK